MRLAFYLDNRGIAGRGPLPDPSCGNPGIGGTEYAFLAVVRLLQGSSLEPLLLLTAAQAIEGIPQDAVEVVVGLPEALPLAAGRGCRALVFRPGFAGPQDWLALEQAPLPLLPWLHNLGCDQQGRYERLEAVQRWLLVSGAQLDAFRHSRLAQRAVVVPNPVAVPVHWDEPRRLETAQAATDLAYMGALTPFKGFDRLARQWPTIARHCPQASLRVFGGADLYGQPAEAGALSPYERHCRELLERGGFGDRVVFEGSCGLDRYGAMEQVAVGVVNPSGRDETFCLAAAEFSACGLPVLAPRRNALIQTVRDQRTGVLVGSDQQLAHEAIALLQTPERAWRLGVAGQRHVQQCYGPEVVRQAWLQLAWALAEQRSPQPLPVSTPWWHEQRWLRQLWGQALVLPGWPSWPELKRLTKRWLQGGGELGPRGIAAIAGLVALLVWAGLVFGKFGGNPTGLARIGERFPANPHLPREQLLVLPGKRGNDGQQFLVLAIDPLQLDPATPQAVDNPIYRGKRLLYPLLAWVTGLGQPQLIVWTLGLLNVGSIAGAAGLVAQWAQLEQRNPRWGLAVLALPGYWITLTLSTADLLATTLLLAAAVAWRQRRPAGLSAALAGAVLTRETALLAWAASGLATLSERRWHWLVPLALVPLPLMLLTSWLKARFAATGDGLLATLHFGPPGLGIVQKAAQLLGLHPAPGPPLVGLERGFDGLCLLFWLCSLAILAVTALRGWGGRWLRITAGIYLLPALCTSTQILARFPDYTRVWIDVSSLALLALLSSRSRWLTPWLATSTLLSLGYGAGYSLLAP
jgi:glycosyltransferase involved in cell wall biosynthesis